MIPAARRFVLAAAVALAFALLYSRHVRSVAAIVLATGTAAAVLPVAARRLR